MNIFTSLLMTIIGSAIAGYFVLYIEYRFFHKIVQQPSDDILKLEKQESRIEKDAEKTPVTGRSFQSYLIWIVGVLSGFISGYLVANQLVKYWSGSYFIVIPMSIIGAVASVTLVNAIYKERIKSVRRRYYLSIITGFISGGLGPIVTLLLIIAALILFLAMLNDNPFDDQHKPTKAAPKPKIKKPRKSGGNIKGIFNGTPFNWFQDISSLSYVLLFSLLFLMIINSIESYLNNNSFNVINESSIRLGISLAEQDISEINQNSSTPRFIPNGLNSDSSTDLLITSFFSTDQSLFAKIYLDNITFYEQETLPATMCLKSIQLTSAAAIPYRSISGDVGGNLSYTSNKFIYHFPSDTCILQGRNYLLPHVLLGVVPIDTHADLGITTIYGRHAPELFPFDEQLIPLNIMVDMVEGNQLWEVSPSLQTTVIQNGWKGDYRLTLNNTAVLHLSRYSYQKLIFIIFVVVMMITFPVLNMVMNEDVIFIGASLSLILGLWGVRDILIPSYIQSSIIIDGAVYVFYIILLIEILRWLIGKAFAKSLSIIYVEYDPPSMDLEGEFVEVKNNSFFSINLSGWHLFDKTGNKFTFPTYKIGRRGSVKIWTKGGQHDSTNLYWGSNASLWQNSSNVATLEDNNGNVISRFSYVIKPKVKSN